MNPAVHVGDIVQLEVYQSLILGRKLYKFPNAGLSEEDLASRQIHREKALAAQKKRASDVRRKLLYVAPLGLLVVIPLTVWWLLYPSHKCPACGRRKAWGRVFDENSGRTYYGCVYCGIEFDKHERSE